MARSRVALTILSLVVVAGCSGSTPASPAASPASFTGTWTGTVFPGTAILQLTITQSKSDVAGTWGMTFSNGNPNSGGTVAGSVNGSTLAVDLFAAGNSCYLAVSGVLDVAGTHTNGTFDSTSCGSGIASGITLTKQ